MSETAIGPPSGAADDSAGAADDSAGAADDSAAGAEDELDEEPELHAAKVTEITPVTATAAKTRPRVKRLIIRCPFEGWMVGTRRPRDVITRSMTTLSQFLVGLPFTVKGYPCNTPVS